MFFFLFFLFFFLEVTNEWKCRSFYSSVFPGFKVLGYLPLIINFLTQSSWKGWGKYSPYIRLVEVFVSSSGHLIMRKRKKETASSYESWIKFCLYFATMKRLKVTLIFYKSIAPSLFCKLRSILRELFWRWILD